ncbi:MAG: lysophospholipase [Bacteroidales bacterium]|nr:lysophospholipase [Bacteroidales bacterium]MBN2755603.1 lysophospholipase [Bacteroidales bacterium]
MKTSEFKITTSENIEIHVFEWLPETEIKAVLQISHGMAEHAERYANLAEFLTNNGFAVYANDHRGHGKTAGTVENLGFFAENNGWDLVMQDMHKLTQEIAKRNSEKPIFLFGHSMGSFLSRYYITQYAVDIKGVIISGTGGHPGLLGQVGLFLTKMLILFNGKRSPSPLMTKLSFGEFNKPFKPNRTEFDWLSRDKAQVDKYIADPFCGTIFSLGFFKDMLSGLLYVSAQESINKIDKNLPIYLFSGANDPVGVNGKGVNEVYNKFKNAGINDVSIKLYENARHEMLNETNKDEVYTDILNWMNKHI